MSDYPKGGDIPATRAWLDKKGFTGIFNNWEADAILGLERSDIMNYVPGENGLKLWGFLNTARTQQASASQHGLAPQIQVRLRISENKGEIASFVGFLMRPLPFKIPVLNMRNVTQYPLIFEYGEAEYSMAVDAWVQSFGGSLTSETTVVANDLQWQRVLQVLCDLSVHLNENDPSSQIRLRPGFTAMRGNVMVIKGEAKCDINAMSTAIDELVAKFHHSAHLLFPAGCPDIPGVVTSQQGASIHRIYYANRAFHQNQVKSYHFLNEAGRVDFIYDIFKIAIWIGSLKDPVDPFHLLPDVRMKTSNNHHVTLTNDGLIKEFYHRQDYTTAIAHIKKIYEAKLPNVEQGITNCQTITITSIGRRLTDAILLRKVDKSSALDGVTRAVNQLHQIGMAHCDICVNNIFVEIENNVVFLGDLEYCRPMTDAPPDGILRGDKNARTAEELDQIQLAKIKDELALL